MKALISILIICAAIFALWFWFEDIPEYEEREDGSWVKIKNKKA